MKNYKNILLIIYFILLAVSVAVNLKFIYILFVIAAGIILYKDFSVQSVWRVVVWAAMLPDNYSPIVILGLAGLYTLMAKRKEIKVDKAIMIPFGALLGVAFISTIINRVPLVNIVFALVYFSSIIIMMLIFGLLGTNFIDKSIIFDLRIFMASQVVATIVRMAMTEEGFYIIKYDDWCTGTYGVSQCAIVYMTMMIGCIVELMSLIQEKSKCVWRYLLLLSSAVVIIATQCVLTMFLAALFFFFGLISKKDKWSLLFTVIGIIGIVVSYYGITKIFPDKQYYFDAVKQDQELSHMIFNKVNVYENTFLNFPSEDIKFALIGDGLGNYNSRAALTCSGYYVELYNRFFQPSVSERVQAYLQPQLKLAYEYGHMMFGSILYRPYSSLLAMMGECGYIGVILFFIIFGVFYKRGDRMMHSLLLAYLSTCLLENYLEYSKVIIILMVAMSVGYSTMNPENSSEE